MFRLGHACECEQSYLHVEDEPTVRVATTNSIYSSLSCVPFSRHHLLSSSLSYTSNIEHISVFLSHLLPGLSHDDSLTAVSAVLVGLHISLR